MPVEQISRYKKAVQLNFCNDATEQKFQQFQLNRGRSTAVFSLLTLAIINLTYAFLEFWILGLNSSIPLYSYLSVSLLSLGIVFFSAVSSNTSALKYRILFPGILTLLVLCGGLYLQHYRLYHAIEITLLVVWIGSLNVLSFRLSSILSLAVVAAFISTAYLMGVSDTNILALMGLMVAVYCLALYLSYIAERSRRMIFLTSETLSEVYERQENWAYTLIDLDMSLSGITRFNDLTTRLMEHIKTVIEYDSYILTALDGKGPKPAADEIDGTLFEQEDKTLWSDDLLTRLSQTRQASVSAQFDIVKGLFGKGKKKFLHFRLDIPIFNDSNLVGVVSLRRVSSAFDDLDMTASVSIATQAMMIYDRTTKASLMSAGMRQSAMKKKPPVQKIEQLKDGKESSSPSTDMDLTLNQTMVDIPAQKVEAKVKTKNQVNAVDRDVTVVPSAVVKKIQQETETARKTITLLSRENAEHVSVDRYRTAAVEGEPLSLLLVEVDGLSSIREKEGDKTAYKVFAGIVKYVFSKTDKESDVLGRYGQNGFSVLLSRVDMNAAEKFAENLREYTEEADFPTPFGIRKATLSIGVAAITDETGNHDSMARRADMALFVAKKNGRNCVKVRL